MKVIGKAAGDCYVCEVSHHEIEKALGKYYGKLKRLEAGQEIDLGLSHNYSRDIESACRSMIQATESFERARNTLMKFSIMVAEQSTQGQTP